MIILDTNVISELMKQKPDPAVSGWIAGQTPMKLAITAIAIAEIQRGILRLPEGKRRQKLGNNFTHFIEEAFRGRILSFDERAGYIYGDIASQREKAGFNVDPVDLMISAIAKSHNAAVATRNIKDFRDCGIRLINPWTETHPH